MDEDVEMDAPQISILREEESPPPQRKAASSRKQKSTPKAAKTGEFPFLPRPRKESLTDDEYGEPEEEEDQLIDDDDDELNKPTPAQSPAKSAEAGQKRKVPSKRKPRKAEKKVEEEKKVKEKQPLQPIPQMIIETPEMESLPPDNTGHPPTVNAVHDNVPQDMPVESVLAPKLLVPPKKKASPRKPPAALRQRTKVTNDKEKLKITIRPMLPPEEMEVASEGGHTGTAASSPIASTTHIEPIDPQDLDLEHPAPAPSIPVPEEPLCLENAPIPIYPLPTKPFPVQPPPKMNTGAAPTIPLDRSGKKVRHWRLAHREIRGIAGGRWFARTWVGRKESQFAAHIAAVAKEGDDKPKGTSASAPAGKGSTKAKGSKNASLAASTSASAAPSRDGSLGPDVPVSISTVRAPTKMRMTLGPDEYVD